MVKIVRMLADNPTVVTCIAQIKRSLWAKLVGLSAEHNQLREHTYMAALEFAATHPDFPDYLKGWKPYDHYSRKSEQSNPEV